MADRFSRIAAQRRALADALDTLSEDERGAPSLYEGWRIRELVVHLAMPFRAGRPRFLPRVAEGGSITKFVDK